MQEDAGCCVWDFSASGGIGLRLCLWRFLLMPSERNVRNVRYRKMPITCENRIPMTPLLLVVAG